MSGLHLSHGGQTLGGFGPFMITAMRPAFYSSHPSSFTAKACRALQSPRRVAFGESEMRSGLQSKAKNTALTKKGRKKQRNKYPYMLSYRTIYYWGGARCLKTRSDTQYQYVSLKPATTPDCIQYDALTI